MEKNTTTTTTNTTASTEAQSTTPAQTNDARLEDLIQRAVDRATNKLGNDNKKLREENEKLKKEKLSDEELKQLELKEKDAELTEREKKLLDKENRLIAIKAIKEIGLDDGSNASLDLVDFVMGEDEKAIKDKVKVFDALVKRFVQAEVDRVFKSNGRKPGVGNAGVAGEDDKTNSVAVRLGQNTAKANKAAKSTLDYYLGGNK